MSPAITPAAVVDGYEVRARFARAEARQHREGNGAVRVRVEFSYIDMAGVRLHSTGVELFLCSAEELAAALTSAGFSHLRFVPGYGGLSEIAAQTGSGVAR